MSSVLVRLRSAARSGAPAPRAQQVLPTVVQLPAGVAAAALDPDHWHAGDPRWAPQVALAGGAARPGLPSPRHTREDTLIQLPADGSPRLVAVSSGRPAAPVPQPSRTPVHPDPSTWFS